MKRLPIPWFLGVLFSACVGCAAGTLVLLQHRFAGYDLSPLIDAGWRIHSGQVPNRDFICTFPPVLYLAAACAFRVFGVRWLALTLAGAAFSLLMMLGGLRILALNQSALREADRRWLASVYCGLQMMLLLAVGFPWHSTWTQGAALYALLATCSLLPDRLRGHGSTGESAHLPERLVHFALACSVLLLAKPNVAAPVLLTCAVALLLARAWLSFAIGFAGALSLASLLLALVHTSLWSTYGVYAQLTSRFRPGHYFEGIFFHPDLAVGFQHWTVYALLLPAAVWLLFQCLRGRTGPHMALRVLAVGAGLATWVGMGTNVEFRLVDAPCLLLGAALLVVASPGKQATARAAVGAGTYALLMLALFYGFTRARMQEAGVWAEAETCGAETTTHDGFFGTFTSCRNLLSVLDETDAVLQQTKPRSVFFGPRMEFLYAREQVVSPRGLPLWWHPGSSYPLGDVAKITSSFERGQPAMLLFLHDDRSYLPPSLLALMEREYRFVPHPPAPGYDDLADDPTAHIDVYLHR